jgi:hypothetical protein
MSTNKYLNSFEAIEPIYQKAEAVSTPNGIVISTGAKLYRAFPTVITPPVYIVDTKNIIHSKKSALPLTKMTIKDLDAVFERKEQEFIVKKVERDPRIEGWNDLGSYVYGTGYQFNDDTLNRWFDVQSGKITEEYFEMVHNILEFNCKRDPALVLANKATLPRGYVMKYQPHELQITPPNTGKSTFFYLAGQLIDKTTRNTLLGSAKWTDDKAYGLFHQQYYALAVDQIESQTVENMAGFLLGFLESGEATVAGGGATMLVTGACPFVVTANPLALQGSHTSVFRDILGFLCRNSYAMGRRFGILAYGNYSPLEDRSYDNDAHRELFANYRALEERVTATLTKFWAHPKIKEFCLKPVYEEGIFSKEINECESIEVASFLRAHLAHSFPHIRGGAVNVALVDNLPRLAAVEILMMDNLDKIVDDVVEEAEDYTRQLKEINVNSIKYALS